MQLISFCIGPAGNGVVRLYRNGVTASSHYYGIVQIWYNGQWGNICDDSYYNQYEADVICHQLGYIGASSYNRAELVELVICILCNEQSMLCRYGTDSNPMLLDDVNCDNNNYLTIFQCSFDTSIKGGCTSNSYDATVYCCMFNFYTSL